MEGYFDAESVKVSKKKIENFVRNHNGKLTKRIVFKLYCSDYSRVYAWDNAWIAKLLNEKNKV
jgi:hypothetical protein